MLYYRIFPGLLTGLIMILFPQVSTAQVSGWITDQSEEGRIAKVSIIIQGVSEPETSDAQGRFSLPKVDRPTAVTFQHPDYLRQQVLIQPEQTRLIISLQTRQLDAVQLRAFQARQSTFSQATAISILETRDLDREQDIVITPMLNRVPGVYMHSGALNTHRITLRGIGARSPFATSKLRAYLEDIPLTNGDGESSLEDIDLSLIERVEVIRGPASSMYGAGLGGVINMSLKRPRLKSSSLQFRGQAGAFGLLRGSMQFHQADEDQQWLVAVNRTHNDGYRDNNTYDRLNASLLSQWYSGEKGKLTVWASFTDVKAFIPSSIDSATLADEPTAAAFTWQKTEGFEDYTRARVAVQALRYLAPAWTLRVSAFSAFRRNDEVRPFNILREAAQQLGTRSSLRYQQPQKEWYIMLGEESFHEWYDWQTYENIAGEGTQGGLITDNEEERTYLNLFSQLYTPLGEKGQLTAGLNFNRTQFDYRDRQLADSVDLSGQYGFRPTLSPRLSLGYQLHPRYFSFATVSHGFSPPSPGETLTPEGALNPDIQPEQGWNIEIGGRGRITDGISLEAVLFRMDIRDLIVARRTALDAYVGRNAGKTLHQGAEIGMRTYHKPTNGLILRSFLSYTLADYRFVDFVDEELEETYDGNYLPGVPRHHLNFGGDILSLSTGLYLNGSFQWVDQMPLRDDNSVYAPAYSLLNMRAGWKRNIWAKRLGLDVYMGVNNLLNTSYSSMVLINAASFGGRAPRYFYPGLPRHIYAGLHMTLGLKS